MKLITVIGRGHGGTRAMSKTLQESGFYMGEPLNKSYDLIPPEKMYEACRVLGGHVRHLGGLQWDFSEVHDSPVDPKFEKLLREYLRTVLDADASAKGWKIPESTLAYPWIARMFPETYFIHWIRDPRDAILKPHKTDDLSEFGVEYERTEDVRRRRAISWKYQVELVRSTPAPERTISVRFEDFVLDQERTLQRLEDFLGMPLARVDVDPSAIGRWKEDPGPYDFDFLQEDLVAFGYKSPREAGTA